MVCSYWEKDELVRNTASLQNAQYYVPKSFILVRLLEALGITLTTE